MSLPAFKYLIRIEHRPIPLKEDEVKSQEAKSPQ